MKKFQGLGRSLSAGEMRSIRGGDAMVEQVDDIGGCKSQCLVQGYDCGSNSICMWETCAKDNSDVLLCVTQP